MIDILITFALIVLVGWGCWYLLSTLSLPEPARKVATVVLVVVLVIALLFGVLIPALSFVKVRTTLDRSGEAPAIERVG